MDVFKAIADPTRRAILAHTARAPARVVDLAEDHAMSRPAVSKHLRLLTEAGLIAAETRGRERHYAATVDGLGIVAEFLADLGVRLPASSATPPVSEASVDALAMEVRRTVRDRRRGDVGDTQPPPASRVNHREGHGGNESSNETEHHREKDSA